MKQTVFLLVLVSLFTFVSCTDPIPTPTPTPTPVTDWDSKYEIALEAQTGSARAVNGTLKLEHGFVDNILAAFLKVPTEGIVADTSKYNESSSSTQEVNLEKTYTLYATNTNVAPNVSLALIDFSFESSGGHDDRYISSGTITYNSGNETYKYTCIGTKTNLD